MHLVEKHIFDKDRYRSKKVVNLCFISKNIFTYANYIIGKTIFEAGEDLNYNAKKLRVSSPVIQAEDEMESQRYRCLSFLPEFFYKKMYNFVRGD
jgi:hypothetical protein